MIRGIIFDLGSTLMYFDGKYDEVDQLGVAAAIEYLNAQGIRVGEEFTTLFRAARQQGWKLAEQTAIEHTVEEALDATLRQLGLVSRDGLLARAVEKYFSIGEPHWHAYPDAIKTLKELQTRGLRLGLFSNADDDGIVQRAVQRLGFAPYLNPALSSAMEPKWRKPDPRVFYLISDAWHLPPNEIAMVGDAARYDVLGARRAGMRGILIDRGDNAPWQKIPDELKDDPHIQPDATVRALAEIPKTISQR